MRTANICVYDSHMRIHEWGFQSWERGKGNGHLYSVPGYTWCYSQGVVLVYSGAGRISWLSSQVEGS